MGEGENQPFIEEIVDGIVDALTQGGGVAPHTSALFPGGVGKSEFFR